MNSQRCGTQSNSEIECYPCRDTSIASICDKSCQKWIFNERSNAIKEGLQGDSGLQIVSSMNDVGVEAFESKISNGQRANILHTKYNKLEKKEDTYILNDRSPFKLNVLKDSLKRIRKICLFAYIYFFNYKLLTWILICNKYIQYILEKSQQNQASERRDNIQEFYNQKNTVSLSSDDQDQDQDNDNDNMNTPFGNKLMTFFENSTVQPLSLIEKQKQGSPSIDLINQHQFSRAKKRGNDQISRMVQIKLYTLEFIKKLKLLKNNRKIDGTTPEQINMIQDLSYFIKDKSLQRTSFLLKCFEDLCLRLSFIPVFIPTNKLRISWDMLALIHLYIFFFCFSIMIFFNQLEDDSQFISSYCVITILIMIFDILIEMNTALFVKDTIVIDRNLIIKEYILSFHFFTDFTSFFVLCSKLTQNSRGIVFNPDNNPFQFAYILISFSKFYGVSLKRKRLENVLTFKYYAKHLYRLFSQVFSVLQIAHIASIGWYSLTFIRSNSYNWLQLAKIEHAPYYQKYIYSVYWAITTMTTVGYGDITATNSTEALYMSINMIIFSCVFAYSINNIGSILQDIELSSKQLKDNIQIIEKYLKRKNINIQLKTRVIQYLHFQNEEEKTKQQKEEEEILSVLTHKLREEITLEANSQIIKKFDIFKLFSQEIKNKLVFIIKEIIISPDEIIFQEGECYEKSIYFIQSGTIQILQNSVQKQQQPQMLQVLTDNQIFGEIAFFTDQPRSATAKSQNLSTLYKIDRSDFIELIKTNKRDYERFQMIQHNILLNNDYKCIQTKCYSCNKGGHTAKQCPLIHQSYDSQFLILRENYSLFQGRKQARRQAKQSFSARILIELNKSIVSKLKNELQTEVKNFSINELSQEQPITNIEIEEYQRFIEEDIISSGTSPLTNYTNNQKNYNEQPSIIKLHAISEQQPLVKNKNQIVTSISNRCIIKEKPDINKLQINLQEYDSTLNQLMDDISPKNANSQYELCSIMKNEVQSQASKKTIRSKTKPPTLLKNLNNLDFTNDQSKLMSKTNSFIELESINVSGCIAAESNLSQEQRYHKQLSSQMTIQLQPEDKKQKNSQHQPRANPTSGQTIKLQNQNLLISDILHQFSSQNLDKEEDNSNNNNNTNIINNGNNNNSNNKFKQALNSEQLNILYNEMQSQLQRSIHTVSTNSNNQSIDSPEHKKMVQKLSKILDFENLRAAVRGTHSRQKSQASQQHQQFIYNFDMMQIYSYYFPKFNYDKIIKQFNLSQLKKLKEQKITKINSLKLRRPNICIRSTSNEASSKVVFLNYLASLSYNKFNKNLQNNNPTNLSYGISLKSCNKYPIKYNNKKEDS